MEMEERLHQLIAARWADPAEAHAWLLELVERRRWPVKEACGRASDMSRHSRLSQIGPNLTEKRLTRYIEKGAPEIPPWLLWLHLADQFADVPEDESMTWPVYNVPDNPDAELFYDFGQEDERDLIKVFRQADQGLKDELHDLLTRAVGSIDNAFDPDFTEHERELVKLFRACSPNLQDLLMSVLRKALR